MHSICGFGGSSGLVCWFVVHGFVFGGLLWALGQCFKRLRRFGLLCYVLPLEVPLWVVVLWCFLWSG